MPARSVVDSGCRRADRARACGNYGERAPIMLCSLLGKPQFLITHSPIRASWRGLPGFLSSLLNITSLWLSRFALWYAAPNHGQRPVTRRLIGS